MDARWKVGRECAFYHKLIGHDAEDQECVASPVRRHSFSQGCSQCNCDSCSVTINPLGSVSCVGQSSISPTYWVVVISWAEVRKSARHKDYCDAQDRILSCQVHLCHKTTMQVPRIQWIITSSQSSSQSFRQPTSCVSTVEKASCSEQNLHYLLLPYKIHVLYMES